MGREEIANNLTKVRSGTGAVFTIRCGNDEHRVHESIVCPQSDVIGAAIAGDFRVSLCS